jgi:flagellar hook-length control protein FliK
MDAIALSMFVEPAALPTPRSDSLLPVSPFGALVAAAAGGGETDVEDSTDTSNDMAASQAGLMSVSAIVSQWLAERDSTPSLPAFARGILEERGSVVAPEAAVPPDAADEPALPLEDLPPTNAGHQAPEVDEQMARAAEGNRATPDRDPTASDNASPDEVSTPAALRAQTEEPRVPIQQLMHYAADIGWRVPSSETSQASAEAAAPARPEPLENADAKLVMPLPAKHSNTAFGEQTVESPSHDPARSAPVSGAAIGDEANDLNPGQPKGAKASDRANVLEQPSTTHASTRTLEPLLQPAPNAQANPASTPSPAPDNVSVPPAGNLSAASESSADMPVKLAVATREGQTAEMQSLALHIAARWAKGDSRFTIRLDPPELGRIDVNLNVTSHGHAEAVLAVEKPQTLDLLLRDAPTLERALKDAGLELGGNLSFSLKGEGRQNFASEDQYSPSSRTVELVPTEAAKPHAALNASLVEQLYGSRTARLDITV